VTVSVNPLSPFEYNPFFRHFFNIPQMPRKFKRELKGLGTGMIIYPHGHILTNNHVAGGATNIEVPSGWRQTIPCVNTILFRQRAFGGKSPPCNVQGGRKVWFKSSAGGCCYSLVGSKGSLKLAGFGVADILLEINGQPTESMESFVGLMNILKPRQKIAVLALDHRSGTTGYIHR
jgi:S1-C subfamily serine protease